MTITVNKTIDVSEKDILEFIVNPDNFDYEETHNEDGSINKEGVIMCFAENIAFCLCSLLNTNEDCLDAKFDADDHEAMLEMFENFVNSNY